MKINHNKLKTIYRDYLEENNPDQRNNCPPTGDILNLVRSRLSVRKKKQLLTHIQDCPSCSRKIKALIGILKEEKNFIKKINDLQYQTSSQKKSSFLLTHFPGKLILVPLITLMLLFVLSLSVFFILNEPNYRGKNKAGIEIINPKKKLIIYENTINFKWNAVPGTEFYKAVLFDQTLLPIWESDELTTNSVKLPLEAQKNIEDRATYFLLVTGSKKSGEKIESQLKEFKVFMKYPKN
jgi:hypothetical protein